MTVIEDCVLGDGVVVTAPGLVNLYGCEVGAGSVIGPFVEVQRGAVLGPGCHVCSHAFVCGGAVLGARVFVGHGVMFCNDRFPVLTPFPPLLSGLTPRPPLLSCGSGEGGKAGGLVGPVVGDEASIGSGAVILPGVRIGTGAIVGAGAVVTRDVAAWAVVVGNPARVVRQFGDLAERQRYIDGYGG